ncbi:uncharacterized protein LOC131158597 [Malania oleifera]|uniref:uncharacterized protein LOC131158597 n=1 Tax=Malania oleifera TaxID=397392 RepID=UPI0025AE4BE6|nr:uncharacterized protein LOC131158597 [Malania oleifera]
MNRAVEAANMNIKSILEKTTETYKDWHDKLPFALMAYKTTVRTSIGATPFSLVYKMEAMVPIEVEIPSLRVLNEAKLTKAEWIQSWYDQLNLIEEKGMAAIAHGQLYQRRMMRAFNRKDRRTLWSDLRKLSSFIKETSWLVLGDFSVIKILSESNNAVSTTGLSGFNDFKEFLCEADINDYPFYGPIITWTNKRIDNLLS